LPKLSAKFDPTKALRYTLSFCAALSRQVDDGRIDIDNSAAERSIRGIALALMTVSSPERTSATAR
jgi:transposase